MAKAVCVLLDDEQEILLQTLQIQSDYTDREVLPARILGTDPSGLQQKVIINRGSADGVREGGFGSTGIK